MIDEILLPLQRDLKPHTSNHMTNVLTRSFTLLLLFLCCALAALADGRSDKRFTLVIDAGHGGHDAGAVGAYSKEKNINLNVAWQKNRLESLEGNYRGYTLTVVPAGDSGALSAPNGLCVLESDCPNQDCVHSGVITRAGQSIVCLPARIVIELHGGSGDGVDAVLG